MKEAHTYLNQFPTLTSVEEPDVKFVRVEDAQAAINHALKDAENYRTLLLRAVRHLHIQSTPAITMPDNPIVGNSCC